MTTNARGSDDALLRYPHMGLLIDSLPLGIVFQDLKGQIRAANPAAEAILGLTLDQMRGVTSVDPRWHAVREDGTPFPGEEHPAMVALQTGEAVDSVVMGVANPQRDTLAWISVSARHFS
ncbi:MAG: PAS domain S-box protein [Chromatiaceae bacterium]|nr:PAS domain S-box protein [Chromatiaceae bacterium]